MNPVRPRHCEWESFSPLNTPLGIWEGERGTQSQETSTIVFHTRALGGGTVDLRSPLCWLIFGLAAFISTSCGRPAPSTGSIVLVDDGRDTVRLSAPATRIVSLIPATTELLFALGAGPRVVGRTTWCDYPPAALQVPSVGSGIGPSVEAVVAADPDLVVIYRSPANQAAIGRFRALGIPTVVLATDRLADFNRSAALLGRATGTTTRADSLTAALAAALEAVTVHPASPPSVFVLAWEQPLMTLGMGSFLSEILARSGVRNLFDDLPQSSATVSLEVVAARQPDFILVTDDREPTIVTKPPWASLRAVRERRFLRVSGTEFNRPSPRMPEAIRKVREALERAGTR